MNKNQLKEKIYNIYNTYVEFYNNNNEMFEQMNLKCYDAFYYLSDAKENYPLLNDDDLQYVWDDFCECEYRNFCELFNTKNLKYIGRTSSFNLIPEQIQNNFDRNDYKNFENFACACFSLSLSGWGWYNSFEEISNDIEKMKVDELNELLFNLESFDVSKKFEECLEIYKYLKDFKQNQVEIFKEYLESQNELRQEEKEQEEKEQQEEQERQDKINNNFYYLLHHNKNYTKEQYNRLEELVELLNIKL